MASTIPASLCHVCRNLNLRLETFVQTGVRYPTSLSYQTTEDRFDELDGLPQNHSHYAAGELLHDDQTYSDARMSQHIQHRPLVQEPDEEDSVPHKHKTLGTLHEVQLRSASGCSLCQFVMHLAINKNVHLADQCTIKFTFKESEQLIERRLVNVNINDEDINPEDFGRYECFISIGRELECQVHFLTDQHSVLSVAGRLYNAVVDYELLHTWLTACDKYHTTCMHERKMLASLSSENLRVIDVKNGCLVDIAWSQSPYVALSYVWGLVPMHRTTSESLKSLYRRGGLTSYLHNVPKTVKDAMCVVKSLGLQFLWVDSVCIVQNDQGESRKLIRQMDQVYALAYLTIVAAEAPNSDTGLPGAHADAPRPVPKPFVCGAGISLFAADNSLSAAITDSPWSNRAWTLQEGMLSPRLLIFTKSTVHFTCSSLSWSEDVQSSSENIAPPWKSNRESAIDSRAHLITNPGRSLLKAVTMRDLRLWVQVLTDLSSRDLTWETDILIAVAGLVNRLERFYLTKSLYGMPQSHLAEFLLWAPANPGRLRRRRDAFRNPFNPSWSWSGWVGEVDWLGGNTTPVKDKTLVVSIQASHSPSQLSESSDICQAAGPGVLEIERNATPYLHIGTRIWTYKIANLERPPTFVEALQPLAWSDVSTRNKHQPSVLTVVQGDVEPEPVGSVVLDSFSDPGFQGVSPDQSPTLTFIQILPFSHHLNDGKFAAQQFYDVLALEKVDNNLWVRVGQGRLLASSKTHGEGRVGTVVLA